jgi:hypothetical protein
MQEITVNLWQIDSWKDVKGEFIPVEKNDPLWLCVTTNGEIKKSDGKAEPGRQIRSPTPMPCCEVLINSVLPVLCRG